MKLSAVFLLSVNVVALSHLPAGATDTASFLQESLADAKPTTGAGIPQPQAKPVVKKAAAKISHSSAGKARKYVAMQAKADNTIAMRPFMPGRFLPSQADLEPKTQYVSMTPRYDMAGPISGQVSTNEYQQPASAPRYNAAYQDYRGDTSTVKKMAEAAIKKVCQVAGKNSNRAVPGMNQIIPQQFQAQMPAAVAAAPSEFSQPAAGVVMQMPNQAQSMPAFSAAPAPVGPPILSPGQDAQLARLMEMNMPSRLYGQSVNGEMRGSVQGNPGLAGAGPPPFPLSLQQGDSPRGVRPGAPMTAQQAKFGSWHGGNNLPQSGFQSYLASRMAGPIKPTAALAHGGGQPTRKTGRQATAVKTQIRSQQRICTEKAPVRHKEPYVATYSSYRRYPG